jgi:hypothetical protein
MRAYALAELGDRLAIDVYVSKEDAWKALEEAVADEPQWAASCSSPRSSWTSRSRQRISTTSDRRLASRDAWLADAISSGTSSAAREKGRKTRCARS